MARERGGDVSGPEIQLIPLVFDDDAPSVEQPQSAGRNRRVVAWVAAAVLLGIAVLAVSRPWNGDHSTTASRPATVTTQLAGPKWTLASYVGADGVTTPVLRQYADYGSDAPAYLKIDSSGQISGNDGCNSFSGPATVEGDRLVVSSVAMTAAGCPAGLWSRFDSVLIDDRDRASAPVWKVRDGQLTLSRAGLGSLVFTSSPDAGSSSGWTMYVPLANSAESLTGTWRLSETSNGHGASSYDWASGAVIPSLVFDELNTQAGPADHRYHFGNVAGTDGCNSFTGSAEILETTLAMHIVVLDPKPCPSNGPSSVVEQIVSGASVQWSLNGNELTLKVGANSVVYERVVPAASAPVASPAPLGTSWKLVGYGGPDGNTSNAADGTTLRISHSGAVSGNDGCNPYTGTGQVTGSPADSGGDAGGAIVFESVSYSAIGCHSAVVQQQMQEFHTVIGQGSAGWSIHASRLTMIRDGGGTLIFAPAP